jgi:ribosomal protein S18 acetylase RimI-like enzyme
MATTTIRPATATDLTWCLELHRRFAHALGFIPKAGMERAIQAGHIAMAEENDQAAGYLLSRRMHGEPHVHSIVQAAVAMDAQRRHHGLAALQHLERNAAADIVQCWCAEDLEANAFWLAAGFQPIALRNPENVRGRNLVLWRKPLTPTGAIRLAEPPRRAGPRAARPKNMIVLSAEQRATIETEPPSAVLTTLTRLGLTLPRTLHQVDVEQLLAAYRAAVATGSQQQLATEIYNAITAAGPPPSSHAAPAPPAPAPASPPREPTPAPPTSVPGESLAARARAAFLAPPGV